MRTFKRLFIMQYQASGKYAEEADKGISVLFFFLNLDVSQALSVVRVRHCKGLWCSMSSQVSYKTRFGRSPSLRLLGGTQSKNKEVLSLNKLNNALLKLCCLRVFITSMQYLHFS